MVLEAVLETMGEEKNTHFYVTVSLMSLDGKMKVFLKNVNVS